MRRRLPPLLALLCGLLLTAGCSAEAPAGTAAVASAGTGKPPSAAVVRALSLGVNIANWFTHRNERATVDPDNDPDNNDFQLIRELGLRHVRIQIDPEVLIDESKPDGFDRDGIADLEKAIAEIQTQGLTVVVALQPGSDIKASLATDPAELKRFNDFWYRLAARLRHISPEFLLFETLNEPEFDSAETWSGIQAKLAGAIRAAAPDHTVVLTGHRYSDIAQLLEITPIQDRNVVYSFHFYDPHNFTHQGAEWGYEMWRKFRGFPYPVDPVAAAVTRSSLSEEVLPHFDHYINQDWNREKLRIEIDKAAEWARRHGVVIYCSEFGAYRPAAPRSARANWLRDVRELLEERDIGWSLWAYAGGFGLATGVRGERALDEYALNALGLKTPPRSTAP